MSIASEISQLNTNKTNIKAAIVGKNPTVSPTDNLSQWPTSIGSIVELKGETKTVTPTTSQQTITPTSGKNGITQITVNPVTSSIDANIQESNIKSGVSILGVNGNVVELNGETKTVTPTTSQQTINPTSGKNGITQMTILPVTSSIDANIIAENIKKDVVILGVTGNYEGAGGGGVTGHTLIINTTDQYNTGYPEYHPRVRVYKSDNTYTEYQYNGDAIYTVQDVVYFEIYDVMYGGIWIDYPSMSGKGADCFDIGAGKIDGIQFYVGVDGITIQIYFDSHCFLKDTKITLANYTEKNVEDITFDDELLVWDFDNGCLSKAKPIWIQKKMNYGYYFLNKYKSGKTFKTTGQLGTGFGHRVFNIDKKKFVYDVESVGTRVYTLDGIDLHMSCERIDELCEYYNIITERHLNLFANRLLTSCSLNNIYEFDVKNMKFIKDERTLRIMSDYNNISRHWFDGLRLSENNSNVNELNKYVGRLIESNKEGEIQC